MSASPAKKSRLPGTSSVTPPKRNNPSPSKTSSTLSEVLRDHARLFGKKPISNDPEDNQGVAESDDSVSLKPRKVQSASRSTSDGIIYNSKEGSKNRLSPNEARNITVKLNETFKYSHVVSTGVLTPLRSKFRKLHIYETPQKKREYVSEDLGERITKNRHEISPIIQQHLNGKLSSAGNTKAARNIFGSSSQIRSFRSVTKETKKNRRVASRRKTTITRPATCQQNQVQDKSSEAAPGAAFPGTVSVHKKVGKSIDPIVRLNRYDARKHSKQNEAALVRENDDTESSPEKCDDSELAKKTTIKVSNNIPKVVISRCDGGTRIVRAPYSLAINDETETRETASENSNSSDSEWAIEDSQESDFVDSESFEEYLPNEFRSHETSSRKRKMVPRTRDSSSDILSSDDSSCVPEIHQKRRPKTRATKEDNSTNEFEDLPNLGNSKIMRSKRPSYCIVCEKNFSDRRSLLVHARIHRRDSPFRCWTCGKKFRHSSSLAEHNESMHESVIFTCQICKQEFASKKLLRRHSRTHTGVKPFRCSHCKKSFALKSTLITHKRVHTGDKPFTCEQCGRSFSDKSNLRRHRMTHVRDPDQFPFSCTMCSKKFKHASSLESHELSHSIEKEEFKCKQCSRKFSDQRNLRKHMRSQHPEESGLSEHCQTCDKLFATKDALQTHIRSHTGRPLTCYECESSFSDISSLRQHVRSHGEITAGDFRCILCERRFKSQQSLESHELQVHESRTPKKPDSSYRCFHCKQTFKSRPELRDHLGTHTDSQETASSSSD